MPFKEYNNRLSQHIKMENIRAEEEKVVKDMRTLFRLKKY